MWFLTGLTWLSILIQLCFASVSIIAGLYYLAEFVEEYTVLTKKIVTWMTVCVLIIQIGLLVIEQFSTALTICNVVSQLTHLLILKTFPYVSITSPSFILACILLIVNHYLAFQYFGRVYYAFSEVMAYFTICLWLVPFGLFISLSANDYVLPTINERTPLMGDDDIVSKYLSRRDKNRGLLALFNYAKQTLMPSTNKKSF